MQITVRFLDNLKLEASFDDFKVISDQPIRYKGDGTAPSPFDYFLASSALCAGYFVKVYCEARQIPTEDIKISQNNIVDPDNRYQQTFQLEIELPESISDHDREGILKAMDRCTVKKVIQQSPVFKIISKSSDLGSHSFLDELISVGQKTFIPGKDSSLEDSLIKMSSLIQSIGINIEISSWRNPLPHVWSVHIRDADSPVCFSNGKGSTKLAALCSALGEFLERLATNYFYSDFYLGEAIAQKTFVHYPQEAWFTSENDELPINLMDPYLKKVFGLDGELKLSHLVETNSGQSQRGVCALPFKRQSDGETVFIPVNLMANIFASNGMSAGNTTSEAHVQALSEIFERAIKNKIILEEISLPDIPKEVLNRFPNIVEAIQKLEELGYPVLLKDASLGGIFPVINVTLMNPRNGGVFASFGAHPCFEIALERTLTELLQGRSFEGLNDLLAPTFNEMAVQEPNNIVDHFIDSTGVVSWKFFSQKSDFKFVDWNFKGSTKDEEDYLLGLLKKLNKEVYICDHLDLGFCATRILVPEFSEIYQASDLIWDNHNRALLFRNRVSKLHHLTKTELKKLLIDLEESGLDDFLPISELIGILFEESTAWGQLTVIELKLHLFLCLGKFEEAKSACEMLMTFNNNLHVRKSFFQILNVFLDMKILKLDVGDYFSALKKLYGETLVTDMVSVIKGERRFYGLEELGDDFSRVEKHQKLIQNYQKVHKFRS